MSQKQSRTSDDRLLPCWLIYLLTLFLTEQRCPRSEGSVWASYSPVLLGYGAHPCLFPAWVFPEGKLNEERGVKSLFPPGEQLRDLSWNRPVAEFIPYPKCFINTGSLPMHCKNKQTKKKRKGGGKDEDGEMNGKDDAATCTTHGKGTKWMCCGQGELFWVRSEWRGSRSTGSSLRRSALKSTPMDFLCARERQLPVVSLLRLDFELLQAAVTKMQHPLQNAGWTQNWVCRECWSRSVYWLMS